MSARRAGVIRTSDTVLQNSRFLDAEKHFRPGADLAALNAAHDFDKPLVRRRSAACLFSLLHDEAIEFSNFRLATFLHILRHRRSLDVAPSLRTRLFHHVRLDFGERDRIAFRCGEQAHGLNTRDQTELIAECAANADRLPGKADDDRADLVMGIALVTSHAGGGAYAIAHAIDAQLGPALTPKVGRRVRTVNRGQHVAQLLDTRRDATVRFADVNRLDFEVAGNRAADVAGLVEIDAEVVANHASHSAAPPNDPRDRFLVDRILRRHDEALTRQVRAD